MILLEIIVHRTQVIKCEITLKFFNATVKVIAPINRVKMVNRARPSLRSDICISRKIDTVVATAGGYPIIENCTVIFMVLRNVG